ncbi:MAG: NPCBM/NEW2 domain-containing protein [Phycisphaerae bacterium]|nr:NPCBM/NEW2 domain-containing protein [Phycisphaerae bacterium]
MKIKITILILLLTIIANAQSDLPKGLRFKIQRDHSYACLPDVSLDKLEYFIDSKQTRKQTPKSKSKAFGISGRPYYHVRATYSNSTLIYKLNSSYDRFVSSVAIDDRASHNAAVVFKVYVDDKLLFESSPIIKGQSPVPVNVVIPGNANALKLVTESKTSGLSGACWLNPGVTIKGKRPSTSYVELFVNQWDPSKLYPVIIDHIGNQLSSRIISARPGQPMVVAFDSSSVGNIAYVYLFPRNTADAGKTSWYPTSGLWLQTRYSTENNSQARTLNGLLKTYSQNSVAIDGELVDSIFHGFPIHHLAPTPDMQAPDTSKLGVYYYLGHFNIETAGNYVFAATSQWACFISIDGKLIIDWPGTHNIHGGRRAEHRQTVNLSKGIHKIEYLNCSPLGEMNTLAAWLDEPAPVEGLPHGIRIMAPGDFTPVGKFVPVSFKSETPSKLYPCINVKVIDDLRTDFYSRCMVAMNFNIAEDSISSRYTYTWHFDDNIQTVGTNVDHLFLAPGVRTVKLIVKDGTRDVFDFSFVVNVHPDWHKINNDGRNAYYFDKLLAKKPLDKASSSDLINLYLIASEIYRPVWQNKVANIALARTDELLKDYKNLELVMAMADFLRSPTQQQYSRSAELYEKIAADTEKDTDQYCRAVLAQAQLKLFAENQPQEALDIIDEIYRNRSISKTTWSKLLQTKAYCYLGLDQSSKASVTLDLLPTGKTKDDEFDLDIQNQAAIRSAANLVKADQVEQLDIAYEKIQTVLSASPPMLLDPQLNIALLDIYLGRKENIIALNLAAAIMNLDLNERFIPEVMLRQVKAYCGLKDIEAARTVYKQLSQDYPFTPAITSARQSIIKTFDKE